MGKPRRQKQLVDLFRRWAGHAGAAVLLLLFVLALYARLLFTNRVLADGDILYYFYPYRDFAAEAVRNGRIPLWNPFIFLGVPFLANPQSATLYPFHWPLSWLSVTKQIYWSAALHTWLLGVGGYALQRRWGHQFAVSLTTGLILAGSGFFGGLVGHINQLNAAAWLPWTVLALEGVGQLTWGQGFSLSANLSVYWRRLAWSTAMLGTFVSFMLLAGHTQTAYINLFGLGVWALWSPRWRHPIAEGRSLTLELLPRMSVYVSGLILGACLSAAQLLPTLELSGLGLRSGGLSYMEASSFSLKPLHLLWTLLPSYGLADLGVVFDTLGYTEFVAYVGLFGLLLALVGAVAGRGRAHTFGLLFAFLGIFLAVGRWNPLYFVFYKLVPGFDLFRVPARWMMLYTLGMAVLAGLGVKIMATAIVHRLSLKPARQQGLIYCTVGLLAVDLLLAARSLPHTQPTAPQAVDDVRTAPAHLLSDPLRNRLGAAAAGRFLSMSTLSFDPGDMPDYRRIMLEGAAPQLNQDAFDQLIVALKGQEILAPNLPLLWRVPAVDGFDGGVLPLQRYIQFLTLFVPPEELVADGRLREQVTDMPSSNLLSPLNVQYVITDKVRDLWFQDVYYDRQIGAHLSGEPVLVDVPAAFEATQIGLIGYVTGDGDSTAKLMAANEAVAIVQLLQNGKITDEFVLLAGGQPGAHFADATLDSAMATGANAQVAYRDVDGKHQEYLAQLSLADVRTPDEIRLWSLDESVGVIIQAITLIDGRTGMFSALLPSDRGRFQLVHSGDVKIYENLDVAPRAFLAHDWISVADMDEAMALIRDGSVDLVERALVEGAVDELPPASVPGEPSNAESVQIVAYQPERVDLETVSTQPAMLVLSDTFFPGWSATVDGQKTAVFTTNLLFRGIVLPAGEHTVRFQYQPASWRLGLWVTAFGLFVLLLLFMLPLWLSFRHASTSGV